MPGLRTKRDVKAEKIAWGKIKKEVRKGGKMLSAMEMPEAGNKKQEEQDAERENSRELKA